MEAYTHNVEIQFTRLRKQTWHVSEWRAKLDAQLTNTLGIIRQDPDDQLAFRMEALHFIKFIDIIKCRKTDILGCRATYK